MRAPRNGRGSGDIRHPDRVGQPYAVGNVVALGIFSFRERPIGKATSSNKADDQGPCSMETLRGRCACPCPVVVEGNEIWMTYPVKNAGENSVERGICAASR